MSYLAYSSSPYGSSIRVVITHQTYIYHEFYPGVERVDGTIEGSTFTASNGLQLTSMLLPEVSRSVDRVYVRGANRSDNHNPLRMDPGLFYRFTVAVDEYNAAMQSRSNRCITEF